MDKNWCKECVFYVPHFKIEDGKLKKTKCGECGIEQDMLASVCDSYRLNNHRDDEELDKIDLYVSLHKCEKKLNQANKTMQELIKKIEELKN